MNKQSPTNTKDAVDPSLPIDNTFKSSAQFHRGAAGEVHGCRPVFHPFYGSQTTKADLRVPCISLEPPETALSCLERPPVVHCPQG